MQGQPLIEGAGEGDTSISEKNVKEEAQKMQQENLIWHVEVDSEQEERVQAQHHNMILSSGYVCWTEYWGGGEAASDPRTLSLLIMPYQ